MYGLINTTHTGTNRMLKSSNRVLASMPALLLLLPVCEADIIAQYAYGDDVNGIFNSGAGMTGDDGQIFDNRLGQSFVADATGMVGSVSFVASALGPASADLRVSLTTFAQGQPGSVLGSVLVGSGTFDSGFLPSYEFTHSIDFSGAGIALTAGQSYALVFSTDTPDANYRMYGDYEGYAGGTSLFSQNGSPYDMRSGDYYFQVSTVVPAPGAAMLLGLAALPTSTRRRR